MKINLFSIFCKRKNLQNVFPVSQFNALPGDRALYPLFLSVEKERIYAYSARFMIKPEQAAVVEQAVDFFFQGTLTADEKRFAGHDKFLIGYKFKEFGQDIVKLLTNDNNFIACLCEAGLEPPAPETVFPDRELSTYGSLQGDMAFWWDVYWKPFWDTLAENEKERYLRRQDLSEDTVQFLKYRR